MRGPKVFTAAEVDREELSRFLGRFYPEEKTRFLHKHGTWWHRGDANRWVVYDGEDIAGYCAVIPGRIGLGGKEIEVAWWIDLIVAPEFRGRGLQRVFDEKVKGFAPLILGFPNALAAGIHREHGWGVVEDLSVGLMPFQPRRLGVVRRRGLPCRVAATLLEPAAVLLRWRVRRFRPKYAFRIEDPSPETLASVWAGGVEEGTITTVRDADWFRWRYFEAPWFEDLTFFGAGRRGETTVVAVTRRLARGGRTQVRVVDFFGAVRDIEMLREAVGLAAGTALEGGADQVTFIASDRAVASRLRRLGFVVTPRARFCWWSDDAGLMGLVKRGGMFWTMVDSDNDEP